MNQEELFSIIGRLYVDVYNTQRYIEVLQKQIQEKDTIIQDLKQLSSKDE
jgi:cell division protein FtsL